MVPCGVIPRRERVSAAPFVKRFHELLDEGMTVEEIARRAGWVYRSGYGDTSYVQRLMGCRPWIGRRGQLYLGGEYLRYETAVKLADAMNLDPVDVGL